RVFVGGISGGATMSNALGCYLGPSVIRGLGINSGTLYPADDGMGGPPDFDYAPDGGVYCPPGQNAVELLPPAIIVWGTADNGMGTSYAEGQGTRDNYLPTNGCDNPRTTTPGPHPPCVIYTGCTRTVQGGAIHGRPHDLGRPPPSPGGGARAAPAPFWGSLL